MGYIIFGIIIGYVICYFIMIDKVHENDNCITSYRKAVENLEFEKGCLKRINDLQEKLLSEKEGK